MTDTPALAWSLPAASIHREPRTFAFTATADQRAVFAQALGIHAVDHLEINGTAQRISTHRIGVAISIKSDLSQLSVVSLDPVPEKIEVSESQTYDETIDPQAASAVDLDAEDSGQDEAALQEGHVPLGALVQELVSVSLNPYPREEGEAWRDHIEDDGAEDDVQPSPFAALSALKSKPD